MATIRVGAGTTDDLDVSTDPWQAPGLWASNNGGDTDKYVILRRFIACFDTSPLTSGATGVSGVISFNGTAKTNGLGSPAFHVSASTPAATNNLVAADYGQLQTTSFGNVSYVSFSTSAYNDITLNASGNSNISLTGISKFGLQTDWDINNTTTGLTWVNNAATAFTIDTADAAGTTVDPKLVVTYTPAVTNLSVNVFDSINVSESVTATSGPIQTSVFDSVTISEAVTIIETNLVANVFDSITIAASTTLQKVNTASVFDSVNVSENITAISPSGNANIFDSVTIAESVTPQLVTTASVVDNITINDNDVVVEVLDSFPSDNIQVSENVQLQQVKNINVFDSVTISESIQDQLVNTASVFDNVTIAETITSSPILQPQVNDLITVSEFYGIFQSLFAYTENWTKASENTTSWEDQE